MTRFIFLISAVVLSGHMASASSAPPADFFALEVCLRASESSCTLKEFVDFAFSPDSKRSWEKVDANHWILTLIGVDKVSKQKGKIVIAFDKKDVDGKAFAEITRIITNDGQAVLAQNGKVYETADKEISPGMLPSYIVPMIQQVNEKTGRAAQARAKNKGEAEDRQHQELIKDFQAIPGIYYSDSERVEIVKVSDDTVKAKISVACKTYDDQILKLKYSADEGRYTSNLKVDKCNLSVSFGPGQMDSIQGIDFRDADGTPKPRRRGQKADCCISGRFLKRTKEDDAKIANDEASKQEKRNAAQSLQNETISALSGQYESKQSKVGGTFTVQAQPDNKVTVSYERTGCKFEEKTVAMEYLKFNKTSVGTLTEGSCSLKLKFMHVGTTHQDILSIDEGGSCKPLCSYSDGSTSLMGNFVKK